MGLHEGKANQVFLLEPGYSTCDFPGLVMYTILMHQSRGSIYCSLRWFTHSRLDLDLVRIST